MKSLNNKVTKNVNFYEGYDPCELIEKFGSPLYVYNERILRQHCRDMAHLVDYPHFRVNYSAKANSNLAILQIVNEEGLHVDAMSPGEMYVEMKAGFTPERIFYVTNNVSKEEMQYAIDRNILMSVDSLSQLIQYGELNPSSRIAIRFNPGVGAGHHAKVITAGKNTKFGVNPEYIEDVKNILNTYDLKLVGINHHVGSLFMDGEPYLKAVEKLISIARNFPYLEFIDVGGGFGIPYNKQNDQPSLDLKKMSKDLTTIFEAFSKELGHDICFEIEPGRYIIAESGVLLGTVNAVKYNEDKKYAGTDLGFNVLLRPAMYDSYHDIEIYRKSDDSTERTEDIPFEEITVVGNICETGDIIAKDRLLPPILENDIVGVLDAGAYGHVMSSNYNNRLRPAEILIREKEVNGKKEITLIRERDTLEDLIKRMKSL